MNKKIVFILVLLLASVMMIGSASAGLNILGGTNSNNQAANDNDTFVVGFEPNIPPFAFKNASGNYTGFDLDLAKEVCQRNNWTFKAQPVGWDAKDSQLNSGSIDCYWNAFTINGRENDYTWSNPYINNKQVFVVKSNSNISNISDLSGKTVETHKNSTISDALKGNNKTLTDKFSKLNEVDNFNKTFKDLESCSCDAVAMDIGVAQYEIKNSNSSADDFKILNESITTEKYGVAFKKGNTQLKDQVQKTLDEMFKDGTVAKIAEKYGISQDTLIQPA